MKHLGDITLIDGSKIEPVDVITFGSPCQDLSIAGKRAGLAGQRSGLFMEAIRIIKQMQEATNGEYPKYAVWENVPGAFSSNKGKDFLAVLEELIRIKEPAISLPEPPKSKWSKAGGCQVADGALLGEPWTPSTGVSPNVVCASRLSSILQANAPEKYYLSQKACEGILRRASRRGKQLPELLKMALEQQIAQTPSLPKHTP